MDGWVSRADLMFIYFLAELTANFKSTTGTRSLAHGTNVWEAVEARLPVPCARDGAGRVLRASGVCYSLAILQARESIHSGWLVSPLNNCSQALYTGCLESRIYSSW